MKSGVKTCANILDQDNKMNSTTGTTGKKKKSVVCHDTLKVPSISAIESLRDVSCCHVYVHINDT